MPRQAGQLSRPVAGIEFVQRTVVVRTRPGACGLLANRIVQRGGELLIEGEDSQAEQEAILGVDHEDLELSASGYVRWQLLTHLWKSVNGERGI